MFLSISWAAYWNKIKNRRNIFLMFSVRNKYFYTWQVRILVYSLSPWEKVLVVSLFYRFQEGRGCFDDYSGELAHRRTFACLCVRYAFSAEQCRRTGSNAQVESRSRPIICMYAGQLLERCNKRDDVAACSLCLVAWWSLNIIVPWKKRVAKGFCATIAGLRWRPSIR